MCIKCEKFNNVVIGSPTQLFEVADSLRKSVEAGDLVEVDKKIDESHSKNISLNEIEEGKPFPADFIEIYLRCVSCNNEIKMSCETYHGSGGRIEIIKTSFLKSILYKLGIKK